MRLRSRLVAPFPSFLLLLLPLSCTHGTRPMAEPVRTQAAASPSKAGAAGAVAPVKAKKILSVPEDTCRILDKLPHAPPIYLAGKGVVLTRLVKTCVTHDGRRGYEKGTPWMAMGFPCTGGSGRIEIKGHYSNPHMVSFILSTDCGMSPAGRDAVQQLVASTLQLPKEDKLLAYTPFVVQYWEAPALSDADTGYAIDLRSPAAREGAWRRFQKSQPIRVNLYGREDTWVPGESFYFVEADLRQTGRTSFRLDVVQVKSLSKEETAQVKQRCEALRPRRKCTDVF